MMVADPNAQFEEPEGLPEPEDDDLDIEILDDMPVEDTQARPATDRMDVDGDEFEQEIKDYSENAQKRIKAVKFEFHEERRSKEAAQRQAEEAIRYAEQVASDNRALKQSLDNSNKVLTEQFDARTDAELEKAKSEFKEAYEGGDTDALVEAQQTLSRLQAERVSVRFNRPAPQQQQQVQQPQPRQQMNAPLPQQDARAARWLRNNPWFQAGGSEDMTGYAVGLHQKLVYQGLNPATDEEYYTKIDGAMRTVFPDRFSDGDQGGTGVNTSAANPPKRKPPVGGPSRGGKPPRIVQLTATQVALAKRLGLSN